LFTVKISKEHPREFLKPKISTGCEARAKATPNFTIILQTLQQEGNGRNVLMSTCLKVESLARPVFKSVVQMDDLEMGCHWGDWRPGSPGEP
jgi:hypothetical protein